MSDPNPYQAPPDIDDVSASPVSVKVVDEIAIETAKARGALLFAAIACGFPSGVLLVSSLLLLTTSLSDQLLLALPGGVLVLITWFCTSLRAHISTLDRRRDESSTRTVVRGYGRLAFVTGLALLATAVITGLVLLAQLQRRFLP